jgi:hypothetical protein
MKRFSEFSDSQTQNLSESRFLRKATALALAGKSKRHGDDAVRHFKVAQDKFRHRPLDTPEERLERLSQGFHALSEGLIHLRRQTGSAVGISLSAVLLSELSNRQLKQLLKK